MKSKRLRYLVCALVGTAAVTAGVASASSAAKSVKVTGTQTVVNEKKGIYDMHGSLVGRWTITAFTPRYEGSSDFAATGTERFDGCHDTDASGTCEASEPSGTMRFTFMYWTSFGPNGKLVKGQCVHPMTGGTGAFAKAKGLIVMHDRPTAHGHGRLGRPVARRRARPAGALPPSRLRGDQRSRTTLRPLWRADARGQCRRAPRPGQRCGRGQGDALPATLTRRPCSRCSSTRHSPPCDAKGAPTCPGSTLIGRASRCPGSGASTLAHAALLTPSTRRHQRRSSDGALPGPISLL